MELDDYLQGPEKLEPEMESVILNLYVILGTLIEAKQWIAAKTIKAAIDEVENSLAAETTEKIFEAKDEIPF